MRPFHLAFPVLDLVSTEKFYVDVLQCSIGRRTPKSINFNFNGHQIVAHLVNNIPDYSNRAKVDGRKVPPFHFGLVMEWQQWHDFKEHLESLKIVFSIKPHIRYRGKVGEQATMFIDDPSGNALEFKSFSDENRLFATATEGGDKIGGGVL